MRHPGPFVVEAGAEVTVEKGASPALDAAAAAGAESRTFLRALWFAAAAGSTVRTLVLRRGGIGQVVAAIPLAPHVLGPFSVPEVPGAYWPYRSVPLAADAGAEDVAALLAAPAGRAALGRIWRLGPILSDDPALSLLSAAAAATGWRMVTRRLGACFVLDVQMLASAGPWPSSKTLRKNRWLERRLGEAGELDFRAVSGSEWTDETFDVLAGIERESWVGRDADSRDTKFLDAHNRRIWQTMVRDSEIATRLRASILYVGGEPAAFTFSLRCGDTLHLIANSYSERFREGSPGRILLYRDFQQAVASGVRRIGWGAGDPGYKREMGARPGPEILDCLFVRGPLLARLLGPLWRRRAG